MHSGVSSRVFGLIAAVDAVSFQLETVTGSSSGSGSSSSSSRTPPPAPLSPLAALCQPSTPVSIDFLYQCKVLHWLLVEARSAAGEASLNESQSAVVQGCSALLGKLGEALGGRGSSIGSGSSPIIGQWEAEKARETVVLAQAVIASFPTALGGAGGSRH